MMAWASFVIVGLMAGLVHAWYRASKAESHYRKLCLISTAITMHHGKVDGTTVELTAPAEIPHCDIQFVTQIHANDRVIMRVELDPDERRRKRKRKPKPVELDEDMALALA